MPTFLEIEKGFLPFWRFVLHLKKELIYVNSLLKFYFGHKFLKGSIHFKLPNLSKPSYLINKELLILLYLSNAFVQTSQKMWSLYSSTAEYFKFNEFIEKLTSKFGSKIIIYCLFKDMKEPFLFCCNMRRQLTLNSIRLLIRGASSLVRSTKIL